MVAHSFLTRFKADGLTVTIVEGRLRLSPAAAITDGTRALVRQYRDEILAELQAANDHGCDAANDQKLSEGPAREESPPGWDPAPLSPEATIEAFEERAAIVEHDAKLPRELAEGLAKLCVMPRPEDIDPRHWQAIVNAAGAFADRWGAEAHALGWTAEELFGVHRDAPMVRVGSMGLLPLFADTRLELVAMAVDQAILRTRNGRAIFYRRDQFNVDRSPVRMVWEPTATQ